MDVNWALCVQKQVRAVGTYLVESSPKHQEVSPAIAPISHRRKLGLRDIKWLTQVLAALTIEQLYPCSLPTTIYKVNDSLEVGKGGSRGLTEFIAREETKETGENVEFQDKVKELQHFPFLR